MQKYLKMSISHCIRFGYLCTSAMEALFFIGNSDGSVTCHLCPHNCRIKSGMAGICRVRLNNNGVLVASNYGFLSSIYPDPLEKKPLYHFYPGKTILSVGSVGCNMRCNCCQNWQISQSSINDISGTYYTPLKIAEMALNIDGNIGIAYTYNEPTIGFEFMLDTAKIIRRAGMKNVIVSNGYINAEPLGILLDYADAFNIDLKAFSDSFYRKVTGARLEPVLETLKQVRRSGRHLEITNLVIPGQNDDPEEFGRMISWISKELGSETVLHLSRYHPAYKMNIGATPADSLEALYEIAIKELCYVYVGNINLEGCQDTKCRKCGMTLIKRSGYHTEVINLSQNGSCAACGEKILGNL